MGFKTMSLLSARPTNHRDQVFFLSSLFLLLGANCWSCKLIDLGVLSQSEIKTKTITKTITKKLGDVGRVFCLFTFFCAVHVCIELHMLWTFVGL